MTEIENRIEQLEWRIFSLETKDYWTFDDRLRMEAWRTELRELKKELKGE